MTRSFTGSSRAAVPTTAAVTLVTGDVIHCVNSQPVSSVVALRATLNAIQPRHAVVLQIERNGQFIFVAYESE